LEGGGREKGEGGTNKTGKKRKRKEREREGERKRWGNPAKLVFAWKAGKKDKKKGASREKAQQGAGEVLGGIQQIAIFCAIRRQATDLFYTASQGLSPFGACQLVFGKMTSEFLELEETARGWDAGDLTGFWRGK